jgi:hypothetical protein
MDWRYAIFEEYRCRHYAKRRPKPPRVPEEERVLRVHFEKHLHRGRIHMKGTAVLQANTDPTLKSRPVSVVVTSNPTPQIVDMIDPAATFLCQPGDVCAITPTGSVNVAGVVGPAGATFTVTAPADASTPSAEVVTGATFAP